jgi:hypothetical protein
MSAMGVVRQSGVKRIVLASDLNGASVTTTNRQSRGSYAQKWFTVVLFGAAVAFICVPAASLAKNGVRRIESATSLNQRRTQCEAGMFEYGP